MLPYICLIIKGLIEKKTVSCGSKSSGSTLENKNQKVFHLKNVTVFFCKTLDLYVGRFKTTVTGIRILLCTNFFNTYLTSVLVLYFVNRKSVHIWHNYSTMKSHVVLFLKYNQIANISNTRVHPKALFRETKMSFRTSTVKSAIYSPSIWKYQ